MKNHIKVTSLICMLCAAFALGGVVIGYAAHAFLSQKQDHATQTPQPLYWVAPMDDNYRRDGPGQSPMGMDLIPVYEQKNNGTHNDAGEVFIAPNMIHNLGVRTQTANMVMLNNTLHSVGYVQFDQTQLVHIHPRVAGWVEQLYVTAEGDEIKKGAPLYALYSPELVNAQEEFLVAISQQNVRLIQAAENKLKALKISAPFIQRLKQTRKVKQHVDFYAPQDGVVAKLNIREGYYVQPNKTMLSMGGLDTVWVDIEVFEQQISKIKVGDKAEITLPYHTNFSYTGQVDFIYPTVNPNNRTGRARLHVKNTHAQLKPNMFMHVKLQPSPIKVLAVPREAVIQTGQQNRLVLALGQGKFKSIEVVTGRSNNRYIEIVDGLRQGESVVTSAQFLIDSESSKTADFTRLDNNNNTPDSVWVKATITDIDVNEPSLSVSHDAITLWGMPAMTMRFPIDLSSPANDITGDHLTSDKLTSDKLTSDHLIDRGLKSKELALKDVATDDQVHIKIIKSDQGKFVITRLNAHTMHNKNQHHNLTTAPDEQAVPLKTPSHEPSHASSDKGHHHD